jgi:hypothetical protein
MLQAGQLLISMNPPIRMRHPMHVIDILSASAQGCSPLSFPQDNYLHGRWEKPSSVAHGIARTLSDSSNEDDIYEAIKRPSDAASQWMRKPMIQDALWAARSGYQPTQ